MSATGWRSSRPSAPPSSSPSGLLGLFAAGSAAAEWRTFLLWRNRTEFGETDAQFGLDLGFFVFQLPWLRFLVSFGFAVVILSLIAAVVTHYLYGGIRLQTPGHRTTPAATAHISLLLGIFMLLKAGAYWLDRYELAVQDGRLITGLQYTDAQALLPAKNILVVIALVCAALFFVNVFRRTWSLPIIGAGLLLLSSFAIGIVYPAIVQQFQVRPAEPARESPYIQRNIEATRSAYGLDDVQVTDYNAKPAPAESDLQAALGTTGNIRLLDPALVSPTYRQLQQIRGFYGFPDALDIDRYEIDGRVRDSVVAVRELDEVPGGPAELGQPAPRLHPRLRLRRRVRQHGAARRQPGLLRGGHPAGGAAGHRAAADLLRREVARSTRSSARSSSSSTSPTTPARPASATTATPARAGCRSATSSTGSSSRPSSRRATSCCPT